MPPFYALSGISRRLAAQDLPLNRCIMNILFFPGINIFGFTVTYYALCIMAGMAVAVILSALMLKRRNASPDLVLLYFICCVPVALICARLYYCVTDGMAVEKWFAWESIRSGGLSIIGGVLGGFVAAAVVSAVKKINILRLGDCILMTVLLAQAIGRWGNYFNQEVYGAEITDAAMQWFPLAVNIDGKWYQALFFYEGVINGIGFAVLYAAAWFFAKKPNGIFTFGYFLWYGIVRTVMEPMRNPEYILGGSDMMWSRMTAVLMIVMGAVGIIAVLAVNYKKEGALIGSKNGDSCAISRYLASGKEDKPYYSRINMLGGNYPAKEKKNVK